MKKLFILLVAVFAFATSGFAANEYDLFASLNDKSKLNAISNYIQADFQQKNQLGEIFRLSAEKLDKALKANDDVSAKKALYFNLANAKAVLSPAQYRKYLTVLNLTYLNRQESLLVAER